MTQGNTCRGCWAKINFVLTGTGDWDWCAHLGSTKCPVNASGDGRHWPVNPVEGIDY